MPIMERIPAGQDATNVQPGDFILCHRKGFVAAIIRLGERLRLRRAQVSHAAFCETPDTLIEALTRGVVRNPITEYRNIEYWIVRAGLTGNDQEQAVKFAQSCVGDRYGFLTDAGIALRFLTPGRGLWFGMNGTQICSGLVAQTQIRGWAIYPVNPTSISPQELFDAYSNTVKGGVLLSSAINSLINLLAARLSGVSPFAKAVVPSVAGLVGALVNMAFAGSFNTTSIVVLGVGIVAAVVTYLVPNKAPAPAPAPVKSRK